MMNIFQILTTVPNEYYARGMAFLGAGIAILAAGIAGLGQGLAAMKAVEAVGRQPEASGKITVTMLLGQALVETSGIYALIVAFLLIMN
jgi:F-type H+-transporting ATPase subunit c